MGIKNDNVFISYEIFTYIKSKLFYKKLKRYRNFLIKKVWILFLINGSVWQDQGNQKVNNYSFSSF